MRRTLQAHKNDKAHDTQDLIHLIQMPVEVRQGLKPRRTFVACRSGGLRGPLKSIE